MSKRVISDQRIVAHCTGCKRGYIWIKNEGIACVACGSPVRYDKPTGGPHAD